MLAVRFDGINEPAKTGRWYWDANNGPAIRVGCRADDGRYILLRVRFGTIRDAESAKRALESAGLTTIPAILQAGPTIVRRLMLESLSW